MCLRYYSHQRAMVKHRKTCNNEGRPEAMNEKVQCNICQKSFPKYAIGGHKSGHYNQAGSKKCDICDKVFCNVAVKNAHKKAVHDKIKRFQCKDCEKVFSNPKILEEHINAVHRKLLSFQCEQCKASFGYESNYKRHLKTVHGERKGHKCEVCHGYFSSVDFLQAHVHSEHLTPHKRNDATNSKATFSVDNKFLHSNEKRKLQKNECEFCGKLFTLQENLKRHQRTAHELRRDYKCKFCDSSYTNNLHLLNHIKVLHDGKKDNYGCDMCDQKFPYQKSLLNHIVRKHKDITKCKFCKVLFSSKSLFDKHHCKHVIDD